MASPKDHRGEPSSSAGGAILDIGGGKISNAIKTMLEARLLHPGNLARPLLPTALLYNDVGMELWERITHLPNYHQATDEIHLLEKHGRNIAQHVTPGSIVLDIGSGEARKITPLLDAIETMQTPVKYFALDLSKPALEKSMKQLAPKYKFVQAFALWGTADDALAWAQKEQQTGAAFWYVSLGSHFGNDQFDAAVGKLIKWRSIMRDEDRMLLGVDGEDKAAAVWDSYHDDSKVHEQFMRNGLQHSNLLLGHEWYRDDDWDVGGSLEEGPPVIHRFVFRARRDVACNELGLKFARGDEIDCYESFKYSPEQMRAQFAAAGLEQIAAFKAPRGPFYEYLVRSKSFKTVSKVKMEGT